MNYRVTEPHSKDGLPVAESAALIILNHVGSSAREDSGRDAQYLADTFNVSVVAADRPGSGQLLPRPRYRQRLQGDYLREMGHLGESLQRELSIRAIGHVMLVGRSAGGQGALTLALTDTLPVRQLYAAEPVGFEAFTVIEGKKRYGQYNAMQAALQDIARRDSHTKLVLPDRPDVTGLAALRRLGTMPLYFLTEKYYNDELWASNRAYRAATAVAKNRTEIEMTLEFAEHSLVAQPTTIQAAAHELSVARAAVSTTPLSVRQVKHTTHASFDKRAFFAERIRPQVARLLTTS